MELQLIVDTDILSAIMKKNPAAISKSRMYLSVYGKLTFSIITRYEILRGLKAKNANKQIMAFEHFCAKSLILPINDEIIVKAAEIYADLKKKGLLISDADILIGASGLVNGFGVVTNNEGHFRRIDGLRIENWLK